MNKKLIVALSLVALVAAILTLTLSSMSVQLHGHGGYSYGGHGGYGGHGHGHGHGHHEVKFTHKGNNKWGGYDSDSQCASQVKLYLIFLSAVMPGADPYGTKDSTAVTTKMIAKTKRNVSSPTAKNGRNAHKKTKTSLAQIDFFIYTSPSYLEIQIHNLNRLVFLFLYGKLINHTFYHNSSRISIINTNYVLKFGISHLFSI